MRQHQTTFSEIVMARCSERGYGRTIKPIAKRAGIDPTTFGRRLKDGRWTRDQVRALDRYLQFSLEDMVVFFKEGTHGTGI